MIEIINEIITRKSLIKELVLKDLKLRYKSPLLGFFWAIILPFVSVAIFYLVFGVFMKVQIEDAPFVLYLMSGVFTWRFLQDTAMSSVTSIIDNRNLLREARFPYYFVILANALVSAINFIPIVTILLVWSSLSIGVNFFILLFPLIFVLHFFITISISIIFATLYVKWRDIKYITEVLLSILFYLTPGIYSLNLVRDRLSPVPLKIYLLNPFVGMLNLYRIAFFKGFIGRVKLFTGWFELIIIPLIFSVFIFGMAVYLYKKNKNSLNDYLYY